MHTRPLNKHESANLRRLADAGLECGLIYLTRTGLGKGYFDATIPIRSLLEKSGIHDYSSQGQGQALHGIYLDSVIFDKGTAHPIRVSVYRPKSKNGDPRMWPSKLKRSASPDDVLALFCLDTKMHFVNLTKESQTIFGASTSNLNSLLSDLSDNYNQTANELLARLRDIAMAGPILADGHGDTSVGRTIETALGIPMNSSKEPDYHGIELKAKRSISKTRQGLFSKVPDWDLSAFKSIRDIIDRFGYDVDGIRKLNCSVYATKVNSQGLFLDMQEATEQLHEMFKNGKSKEPICLWKIPTLHRCLLKKHQETFWISADEIMHNSKRYFKLRSIKHTRLPSTIQFNRLLLTGEISVDHMIKQTSNKVRERGPQFKVQSGALEELFIGASKHYSLV